MKKNVLITVHGRVQDVGFRYFTVETAGRCNITGFVKNQWDGSVFIEAEGEENMLDVFVEICKQGPSMAHVDKVDIQQGVVMNHEKFSPKY